MEGVRGSVLVVVVVYLNEFAAAARQTAATLGVHYDIGHLTIFS